MNRYLAMGAVALGAILWGFIGFCSRSMYDGGLDAVQINAVRGIISALVLVPILVLFDRESLKIRNRKGMLIMLFTGAMKFIMDICYFQSQMCVSLALAGILLATDAYFMLAISLVLFRGGITPNKVLATFLGFFGLALLMNLFTNPGEINLEGVLYGLGSGFFGAFYSTGVKLALNNGCSTNSVLFYSFFSNAILYLLVIDVPVTFSVAFGNGDMIGYSLMLTFLFTMIPYYCYTRGMETLEPITVLILTFLEAVTSALVGVIMFSEPMDAFNVIGIALVLGSILLMNIGVIRYGRKRRKKNGC